MVAAQSPPKEVVVFDSGAPPSPGGFVGFDIFALQSLGERFIPDATVQVALPSFLFVHFLSSCLPSFFP
jgi:hypothetical protein